MRSENGKSSNALGNLKN